MCYGTEHMEGRDPRSLSDLRAAAKEQARAAETANMEAQRKYKRENSWFGRIEAQQKELARRREAAAAASVGPPVFQLNQNLPQKKSPQKPVLKIGRKSSVKTGSSKGRTGSTGSLRTPKTTINI